MSALLAKGNELVIASHNQGKVREIAELLAPFGFTVTSAAAYGLPEPEETGLTFAANAEIKALATSEATGKASLSDDSGLAVEALDGAPGIYSARWAGENKDFGVAMERIRQELTAAGLPESAWRASFICALCLHVPGSAPQHFEGRINGLLTFPPRGERGFGYDPIFIPEGETRTFAEMSSSEKHAMSHRARAFSLFVNALAIST